MRRVIRQSYLSYKALYSYADPRVFITMMIINPTLQLIYFAFMVRFAYGDSDISPWIIGNAFLLASSNCIFIIGSLVRNERQLGTIKYVLGSPANNLSVFLSRSVFHLLDIFFRVILGFIIGVIFFNFRLHDISTIKLLITILTGMLSGLGFGLLIGSISLLSTDVHLFLNTMEQLIILMTGALFPLSRLPREIGWIPQILPLRRSIEAARLLLNSNQYYFYKLISEEILLASVLIVLGFVTFEVCQYLARNKGTIDLY